MRMAVNTIRRNKNHERVKDEFVNSFRKKGTVEEPGLNIDNLTDPAEATTDMNS